MLVQCQHCNHRWSWTPRKGSRLANAVCPDCGGPLKKAKPSEEEKRARSEAFGRLFQSFRDLIGDN